MPMIRRTVTADNGDIFSNDVLSNLPRAALISLWAVGAGSVDTLGLSVGTQIIIPQGTRVNLETAAQRISTSIDQMLFREAVPPGKVTVPVDITSATMTIQLNIEYL